MSLEPCSAGGDRGKVKEAEGRDGGDRMEEVGGRDVYTSLPPTSSILSPIGDRMEEVGA